MSSLLGLSLRQAAMVDFDEHMQEDALSCSVIASIISLASKPEYNQFLSCLSKRSCQALSA
jgi:hypothetical protein